MIKLVAILLLMTGCAGMGVNLQGSNDRKEVNDICRELALSDQMEAWRQCVNMVRASQKRGQL